jgi:hypothetical protein
MQCCFAKQRFVRALRSIRESYEDISYAQNICNAMDNEVGKDIEAPGKESGVTPVKLSSPPY